MKLIKRRKTPTVKIGNVLLGSAHPVVIQSMTNTPTNDIKASANQTCELIEAGSEMVRLTVDDDKAGVFIYFRTAVTVLHRQLRQR